MTRREFMLLGAAADSATAWPMDETCAQTSKAPTRSMS